MCTFTLNVVVQLLICPSYLVLPHVARAHPPNEQRLTCLSGNDAPSYPCAACSQVQLTSPVPA